MLASLNHIAGWGEGIEVDTLVLLTMNSLKTGWQEEAVSEGFASKFSQKNCSSRLQIPGGHVTGYFLVSILMTLRPQQLSVTPPPPPTATSSLYFLCFGAFCLRKNFH